MNGKQTQRTLPWSAQQLFNVIADVEAYPAFMPGYRRARVTAQEERSLRVEQLVGIGPIAYHFVSQARLESPAHLHIHSTDGPFRLLEIDWQLQQEGAGCRVTLDTRFELRNRMLQQLASRLSSFSGEQILAAISRRAAQLYGQENS